MRATSLAWTPREGWNCPREPDRGIQLVMYFGTRSTLADGVRFAELRGVFPCAEIVGCTTSGQIGERDVRDDGVLAIALRFAHTRLRTAVVDVASMTRSRACGTALASRLDEDDLSAILILSDGLKVNGTALVAGLSGLLGPTIRIVGGLAGDGTAFVETLVGANDAPASGRVAAIGFYGSAIRFATGAAGGWDAFGPRRKITRSDGATLFELDGKPALDLYERYLGEEAANLPGSGLFFPLRIHDPVRPDHDIVRTLMSVDRSARSVSFAGDVPEGWVAQLMRANHDRLVDGASDAVRQARTTPVPGFSDTVALLVSCVGRRAVMGQRVGDEIDAVVAELEAGTKTIGFYSYGEIAPHAKTGACEFHNQMMTVAILAEAV